VGDNFCYRSGRRALSPAEEVGRVIRLPLRYRSDRWALGRGG
jgi:hypothetical protein